MQAQDLTRWLGVCCDLYNAALQERREAWRTAGVHITRFDQNRALVEIRAADADVAAVPSRVARSALQRVDLAFGAFFRRCKTGQKPGYPRFQSKRRYNSFSFSFVAIDRRRIHIPKIGLVRFHTYRPLDGIPREVRIGREPTGRWYVSIGCDIGKAPPKVTVRTATGIDLGLTTFATLSDGTEVPNPRFFRAGEAQLARRQRVHARRQYGSASCERARVLVAKTHRHIANQRKDFNYKLSKQLLEKYDLIAHEDLAISRMVHGHLAKSIKDAAWGTFLRCLASKAESAGKHVIAVDPRGTTQRCSGCGATVHKSLAERQHTCTCGVSLGRDHNAALNILALGRSAVEAGPLACEAEGVRFDSVDPLPVACINAEPLVRRADAQ